jgi:NTE family protein
VGRIERPLRPPRNPFEVGLVAFEIARRHRFAADMAAVPGDVTVHVLPSGSEAPSPVADVRRFASGVEGRIARAQQATTAYLTDVATRQAAG